VRPETQSFTVPENLRHKTMDACISGHGRIDFKDIDFCEKFKKNLETLVVSHNMSQAAGPARWEMTCRVGACNCCSPEESRSEQA
jgi:hypothetical protein